MDRAARRAGCDERDGLRGRDTRLFSWLPIPPGAPQQDVEALQQAVEQEAEGSHAFASSSRYCSVRVMSDLQGSGGAIAPYPYYCKNHANLKGKN